MSQTIFSDAKNPLSHTGHTGWTFFLLKRPPPQTQSEFATCHPDPKELYIIDFLPTSHQSDAYHQTFKQKKPSKLRSKDIRIVFLQRQTVFQDFPPKLDLLTIVMLIGIRHCQVTVPNYCDNDCMFVMFISSSNEEKYAQHKNELCSHQAGGAQTLLDAQYVANLANNQHQLTFLWKKCVTNKENQQPPKFQLGERPELEKLESMYVHLH